MQSDRRPKTPLKLITLILDSRFETGKSIWVDRDSAAPQNRDSNFSSKLLVVVLVSVMTDLVSRSHGYESPTHAPHFFLSSFANFAVSLREVAAILS